jgi:PucR family transcriptional regulator, purine catabolism regulatory protein
MALTVAEVLDLPVLRAGDPEVLSKRHWDDPVRWVHVGDVADLSPWLQGGELVLTTGAALHDAPARYLRGIADAGALGVVVELGSAGPLPESAAAIAEELDLALVALHHTIRFVEVTEEVHRRIVSGQFEEVAFDRRVHRAFTDLSMRRVSATGIVDAAASMLDEPVVLEDLAHQALAVAHGPDATADLLQDWEQRSRRATADGGAERWAVTAVGPRGEEWGRLIVPRAPADAGRTGMVLERAAAALALHRMIERDRTGLHQQAQSGLIDDVLRERVTDEREIAARAIALGLRKAARYHPLVVRARFFADAADPVADQRRNVSLLDAVVHTVNASGHTGLFTVHGDGEIGAVVALGANKAGSDRTWAALGAAVTRELGRGDGRQRSVLAVGEPCELVVDAVRGIAEAAHVAEVALAMRGDPRPFYRASDVRLRGLLALLQDDPHVQAFAETELKALLRNDSGRAPTDLAVLREFLRLTGNKAALAKRLHLSRPALYKRLSGIEQTLGVHLDDAESMVSLHVAMLILEVRRGADVGVN